MAGSVRSSRNASRTPGASCLAANCRALSRSMRCLSVGWFSRAKGSCQCIVVAIRILPTHVKAPTLGLICAPYHLPTFAWAGNCKETPEMHTTDGLRGLDQAHFLHPFTDLSRYAHDGGRVITRAEHVYIYDSDDQRMLDGMSGLWCCNLGYSQPAIVEAVHRQLQSLPFYNSFFQCSTQPAVELARALVEVTPAQFNHVFFTNSGSEANDTNLRLVQRYYQLLGKPGKRHIISRRNAYHGSTIAGA